MSHELRTPLNAVIGFSEILLENAEFGGHSESKKADLKRINAAGQHLLSLVTDVLDLSKIESNFIELKIEQFDLPNAIHGIVANCEPMIAKKGNKLIFRCADDLGTVSTDATKLRQATLNLLSNASKFTENGTITLSVYRRKSSAGDWIEIQVPDTGIGMAKYAPSHLRPKLYPRQAHNFDIIRWNRAWALVESKAVWPYGRRHNRGQRYRQRLD